MTIEQEHSEKTLKRKLLLLFAMLFALSFGALVFVSWPEWNFRGLKIIFFDVGQGDAIYIRTPDKKDILIDGGPDNSVVYKLGEYMPLFDRTIEYMILTHPHADHVTGLVQVLRRYTVKNVLFVDTPYDTPDYAAWLSEIKKEGANIVMPSQGEEFRFGDALLKIIYPTEDVIGKPLENVNNASFVTKFSYGDTDVLLEGDAEKEEEAELLRSGMDISAEVLKAGHHGSKTSSTPEFLDAVHPETAVISAGEGNAYGHPHFRTLHELESRGIRIFRTDEDGDVILKSDGKTYEISGFR